MQSQRRSPVVVERTPAPRRPALRPVPQMTPEHAHLSLQALRSYRKALTAEEGQVSYWRRIIQARLDVVRAGSTLDSGHLRAVLADAAGRADRTALVEVVAADEIPPLPDLAGLWDREVDPRDEPARDALAADLQRAETQLSEYRRTVHVRLAAATTELIARYREQPALCLTALPLEPERRSVPA